MLKLPLCPYCGARFLYPDVRKTMNRKTGECPHCKKTHSISLALLPLLIVVALLLIIGMNWLFLMIPSMNLPFLMIITAIGVVVVYFLTPFTVRYKKKMNIQEEQKKKE